jgi:2'-5' RNA ligase
METVRAFIAVDIGDAVRGELEKLQRRLRGAHADVKWVKPENIHLTLDFLGHVDIDKIRPLEAAMAQAVQRLEKFSIAVSGTGTFGKPRRPRVVWAGIADCPPLLELQRKTTEALQAAEVGFDDKPFSPHLTLGRVKSPKHMAELLDGLEKERDTALGCADLAEVLLIKSEPGPGGAKYTVLHRVALPPPYFSSLGTVK